MAFEKVRQRLVVCGERLDMTQHADEVPCQDF